MTTQSDESLREQKNIAEWEQYLVMKVMRNDDRSMPYIASKFGYLSASSVQNIFNRFQGLEKLIEAQVLQARIEELESLPWKRVDKYGVNTPYVTKAWLRERTADLNKKLKELK